MRFLTGQRLLQAVAIVLQGARRGLADDTRFLATIARKDLPLLQNYLGSGDGDGRDTRHPAEARDYRKIFTHGKDTGINTRTDEIYSRLDGGGYAGFFHVKTLSGTAMKVIYTI
jgi:hypothetical protein